MVEQQSTAPLFATWNGSEVDLNDESVKVCRDMNIGTALGHVNEKLFKLYNGKHF